jgi:hypothetical protein
MPDNLAEYARALVSARNPEMSAAEIVSARRRASVAAG